MSLALALFKLFQIITNSTRDISLEEVTLEQIREHGENRPEEVELIAKAL
jgi:hypothetical protein